MILVDQDALKRSHLPEVAREASVVLVAVSDSDSGPLNPSAAAERQLKCGPAPWKCT